jgi:hypothetical protein
MWRRDKVQRRKNIAEAGGIKWAGTWSRHRVVAPGLSAEAPSIAAEFECGRSGEALTSRARSRATRVTHLSLLSHGADGAHESHTLRLQEWGGGVGRLRRENNVNSSECVSLEIRGSTVRAWPRLHIWACNIPLSGGVPLSTQISICTFDEDYINMNC